jgi:superkiller protein 3
MDSHPAALVIRKRTSAHRPAMKIGFEQLLAFWMPASRGEYCLQRSAQPWGLWSLTSLDVLPADLLRWMMMWLVLASVALCAHAQQIPSADRHYQRGLQLEKEQKLAEAAIEFEQAIQVNPEFSDAYYHLGLSYLSCGRPQDAIRAWMQLSQLEPENAKVLLAAGQVYDGLKYFDDALTLYVRAASLEPQNASIYFNIGSIYSKQGHYQQATDSLTRALALDPSMDKARLLLSSVYESTGNLQEAIQVVRKGLELAPDDIGLLCRLGEISLLDGRPADAEAAFRGALSLQPKNIPADMGLGKVLVRQRRFAEAISLFSGILQDSPAEHDALLERGKAEFAAGNREKARKEFEAYAQATPEQEQGPDYYLGVQEVNAAEYENAVADLKKALSLNPGKPDTYYYLGQAYDGLGQFDDAQEALNHCLSLSQNHRLALKLLSEVKKKQGKP